jgi:hypothetical protein
LKYGGYGDYRLSMTAMVCTMVRAARSKESNNNVERPRSAFQCLVG